MTRTRLSGAAWVVRIGIVALGLILVLVALVPGDQQASAVVGEGWVASPPGACALDRSLAGPAEFRFAVEHEAGATQPQGRLAFDLGEGGFRFESTSTESMSFVGGALRVIGAGTVGGSGAYGFMLVARDSVGGDKLGLKVWDRASGSVVYDNQLAAPRGHRSSRLAVIGGGSIEIQRAVAAVSPTRAGSDQSGSKRRGTTGRWH